MFLCVQDLTCPGSSFIHSASLAAHIPGVAAIEANSRQYCPDGECQVGREVPRHVHDPRRDDEHRDSEWPGAGLCGVA